MSAGDPGAAGAGILQPAADGVRVRLRVTPRASSAAVRGVVADDAGRAALAVQVTAAPEDGRANDAVVALLARQWRLPRSALTVAQGAAARIKILHVAGEPAALMARLAAWVSDLPVTGRKADS